MGRTNPYRHPLGRRCAALAVLAALLLAACSPDGTPCDRAGDVKVDGGVAYVCKKNFNGNLVWLSR